MLSELSVGNLADINILCNSRRHDNMIQIGFIWYQFIVHTNDTPINSWRYVHKWDVLWVEGARMRPCCIEVLTQGPDRGGRSCSQWRVCACCDPTWRQHLSCQHASSPGLLSQQDSHSQPEYAPQCATQTEWQEPEGLRSRSNFVGHRIMPCNGFEQQSI